MTRQLYSGNVFTACRAAARGMEWNGMPMFIWRCHTETRNAMGWGCGSFSALDAPVEVALRKGALFLHYHEIFNYFEQQKNFCLCFIFHHTLFTQSHSIVTTWTTRQLIHPQPLYTLYITPTFTGLTQTLNETSWREQVSLLCQVSGVPFSGHHCRPSQFKSPSTPVSKGYCCRAVGDNEVHRSLSWDCVTVL